MPSRTAKEVFLGSTLRAEWEKLVQTPAFEIACQYAMLSLMEEQVPAIDPSKSWDVACRLTGARRLIQILKELPEPIKDREERKREGLNYNRLNVERP